MGYGWKAGRIDDPVWSEPAPTPARPSGRPATLIAAVLVMLIVGGGIAWWVVQERTKDGIAACAAVTQSMAEQAIGTSLPTGVAVRPDGDRPGATECIYGTIEVFAFRQGAASYFNQVLADDRSSGVGSFLSGPGYKIDIIGHFVYAGMQAQTFTLIKHGQYVNVLITSAPEGTAARLAVATAKRLP